jgi:hypothetical protein
MKYERNPQFLSFTVEGIEPCFIGIKELIGRVKFKSLDSTLLDIKLKLSHDIRLSIWIQRGKREEHLLSSAVFHHFFC